MDIEKIRQSAADTQERARTVLSDAGIAEIWREAGCRVNLVGSLRMGLLVSHRDIDLHVYSKDITAESSFAIAAKVACNPRIVEIKCINGLHTDEHCVAWHFLYKGDDGAEWQFDVIHIEEGSCYDGYFERMADRITAVITSEERDAVLLLKYETPETEIIHGVEYYEAVIADGVRTMPELQSWLKEHRKKPQYYWIP